MAAAALCDSHVHVFDPARFSYAASRQFTPDTANVQRLTRHLDQAGMARVVLVQPSVYGTDNNCMLDAMATLGARARGIAVLAPDASQETLEALSCAGVVGARLNMVVNRSDNAAEALHAVERLDALLPRAWHIQLHVSLGVLSALSEVMGRSDRLFVLDHLGLPPVHEGPKARSWQKMLDTVKTGRLCVKLSGPYLSSASAAPYVDLQPFVDSLVQTDPEAIVWGSNWPHTHGVHRSGSTDLLQIERFRDEDPKAWPGVCARWLGSALFLQMHRNAGRVYGFDR